jgi:LPS export ABC transporter protein LptC
MKEAIRVVFFTLFLIPFVVSGCYYDVEPPVISVDFKSFKTNEIFLISKEFKYLGIDPKNSKKSYELFSEEAIILKDGNIKLRNIDIKFYNSKGNVTSSLQGDLGVLFKNSNMAEVISNVVLQKSDTKTTIYSTRLVWDGNKKLIYNDKTDSTTIVSPSAKVKGRGLRTTPDIYPLELEEIEATIE